jgi:penicillin amidase
MNQAQDWPSFRAAFRTFGVPGLNMLYADRQGNIGQLLAVHLPDRGDFTPPDLILDPSDPAADWGRRMGVDDLPTSFNPREGFLVSANNRPVEAATAISYFFAPDDRLARIKSLLADGGKIDMERLRSIQEDVYMSSADLLNQLFVEKIDASGVAAKCNDSERAIIALLRDWDARYDAESRGALAFELVLFHFTRLFSGENMAEYAAAAHSGVVRLKSLLVHDVTHAPLETLTETLHGALRAAATHITNFQTWGDMHRMRLEHPLAILPVIGKRYRFVDYPASGSSDTVMKTAHGLTDERHGTPYGAMSRHISDLADLDRNFFVLLGGQDGWINSANFLDQVPLWRSGRYIQVPLRLSTVRATFPHRTLLLPRRGADRRGDTINPPNAGSQG